MGCWKIPPNGLNGCCCGTARGGRGWENGSPQNCAAAGRESRTEPARERFGKG